MSNQGDHSTEDLLSAQQLEKLILEIENLRKDSKWKPVAYFMPIIATLLGVAGFFFSVVTFESQRKIEQQKDRITREVDQKTRFQNQIRTDIDELFTFTRDNRQSVASVSYLLEDMKIVLGSQINQRQSVSDIFPEYRRSLTESLVILIRDDCDFSKNPRDVGLANMVLRHWDDYSDYLKNEPRKLDYILYKYARALQGIRDQMPGYIDSLKITKEGEYKVDRKYEIKENESVIYGHFIDLVDGFREHIKIFEKGKLTDEVKGLEENNRRRFQAALCNKTISEHIIGTYFPDQS